LGLWPRVAFPANVASSQRHVCSPLKSRESPSRVVGFFPIRVVGIFDKGKQDVMVVSRIHHHALVDLVYVCKANRPAPTSGGRAQRRKEQRRKDSHDGDYNQQFNERESFSSVHIISHFDLDSTKHKRVINGSKRVSHGYSSISA